MKTESDISTSASPFSLATDDEYDIFKSNTPNDDSVSVTEGVDVLGAGTPENFWAWSSLSSGRIVTSRLFKRFALVSIFVNSILMGFATVDWVRANDTLATVIDVMIQGFRLVFTVEILLDICHYQKEALHMGWIIFDICVISLSWIVSISLLVMRSFRLIRALRKASGVGGLNHLVKALIKVFPKMMSLIFLLGLVLYSFAVIFTDLYQDMYDLGQVSYDYFGRLDRSAFTLFQIMMLDGFADIAKEVMAVYPWSSALFILFVVLTSFFFGTLAIAVMGEAFHSVTDQRMNKALEEETTSVGKSGVQKSDVLRLEKRMEELSGTVENLLLAQQSVQESLMHLLQEQRRDDASSSPSTSTS